jgi:hypothetical protein
MIRDVHPGSGLFNDCLTISDPGVKKAPEHCLDLGVL